MTTSPETTQPEIERALTAEADFHALIDAAVDGMIVIDEAGTVETINAAAEDMFGYAAAQVVGHNVRMLMPERHSRRHDGYLRRYIETGEARIIGVGRQTTAKRKDGSTFPIELSVGEAIFDGNRRFVGIIRDVTERMRTAEELRRREELLSLTLNNAPLGIATATLDGRFLSVNPACCRMLGYEPNELTNLGLVDVTAPDQQDACRSQLASAAAGLVESAVADKRCVRKDGQQIHGRLHLGVVHDGDGKPRMLVVQVEDMTEKVRAREEARLRRNRLAHVSRLSTLGEMAAGIAHEINQPLTAIATYAEACRRLVESGNAERSDILDTLSKTGAQARRAGEVIRRVRALARRRSDERAKYDLNAVIRDVVRLAEVDARMSAVSIELNLADGLPLVEIDAVQIQQVLLNLLRNSLEALGEHPPPSGALVVHTAAMDDDIVQVAVVDAGAGIPEVVLPNIFEPFFTTKLDGTGMGLSISRTIVSAHGGNLTAANNPSGGATLRLTLPAAIGD